MTHDDLHAAVGRAEALLKALVKLQMAPLLEKELEQEDDRKLYELTGKATQREIQKKLKMGPGRISATWARWEGMGLLVKEGNTYRKVV